MIPKYAIPIATLTILAANLAAASAFAKPPPATNCSGLLQCLMITSAPDAKPSGSVTERPRYNWGFPLRDRDDRYSHGSRYKNPRYVSAGTPF